MRVGVGVDGEGAEGLSEMTGTLQSVHWKSAPLARSLACT